MPPDVEDTQVHAQDRLAEAEMGIELNDQVCMRWYQLYNPAPPCWKVWTSSTLRIK